MAWTPPPNWPAPPHDGWYPPADWQPDAAWGPAPEGWVFWPQTTPSWVPPSTIANPRAIDKRLKKSSAPLRMQKVSKAASTDDGLRCPKCGGQQFKARRSNSRRLALVPVAVLMPLTSKNQVQCVTCGQKFRRG
jgi:DNA-directed RNA polymerase subunit RPC12/RpoP